jgi:CDP-paratose 2-epimerase
VKVVITGGAGFIGVNAALRCLRDGWEVVLLDNLSRKGAHANLEDLRQKGDFELVVADMREGDEVHTRIERHRDADLVLHLAAQVAVTTSVEDPVTDSAINIGGTLNLLEALRSVSFEGLLVFASTNKVYGKMDDLEIIEVGDRYEYGNLPKGIGEDRPLDFHSPYGCSKGAADQYVRDYSRVFGLKTAVFRQSCIYGPHQYGVEDQGWVAWFTIAAVTGQQMTVFGDGKQVRDVLFVDDLVDSFLAAYERREEIAGQVFNIGGGPGNVLSLVQLIAMLKDRLGVSISPRFDDWRPGDQKIFVSDIRKAHGVLEWKPTTTVESGVSRLVSWVEEVKERFF